jgi:transposase-like protein
MAASETPVPETPRKGLQRLAPIFPAESTLITPTLAVCRRDGAVVYFTGSLPVYRHQVDDEPAFRMFVAQLCAQGTCKQVDIVRVFGVAKRSLIRWVAQFQDEGPASFFRGRKPVVRPRRVWTPERVAEAQRLLDAGHTRSEVARIMELKPDTVRKAVLHGTLHVPEKGGP